MEIESQRRTGRTTRLIEKAIDCAVEGKRIAFVCERGLFGYVSNIIDRVTIEKKIVVVRQRRELFEFSGGGRLELYGAKDNYDLRMKGKHFDQVIYDHAV